MLRAVSRLKRQFTARDMALELNRQDEHDQVREELDRLLCDVRGTYELSKERDGEIVYKFPADFVFRAYQKRTWLFANEKLAPIALKGLRLFIGFFLVFSLVLCVLVLVLISLREGGNRSRSHTFADTYNTFVLWSFWRRNPFFRDYDNYAPVQYAGANDDDSSSGRTSSLADEVFAFIFGTPRHVNHEARWDNIKTTIRANNFVVTSEQLRPFSRIPEADDSNTFMGEICAGLGGVAEASSDGQHVHYRFDALRDSQAAVEAAAQSSNSNERYYREPQWILFDRSVTLAMILGAINLFALLLLFPYLRMMGGGPPVMRPRLRGSNSMIFEDPMKYMQRTSPMVYYLLQLAYCIRIPLYTYGILYLAIPLLRYVVCIKLLNPRIQRRNELRVAAVKGRTAT